VKENMHIIKWRGKMRPWKPSSEKTGDTPNRKKASLTAIKLSNNVDHRGKESKGGKRKRGAEESMSADELTRM